MTDLELMATLNVEIHRAHRLGDDETAEKLKAAKAAAYKRWIASR